MYSRDSLRLAAKISAKFLYISTATMCNKALRSSATKTSKRKSKMYRYSLLERNVSVLVKAP